MVDYPLVTTLLPRIAISPSTLQFTADRFDALPPIQTFTISNAGGETLEWLIDEQMSWLDVTPVIGTSNNQTITVSVNTTSISPSTYNGDITISSINADNSPVTIPITYELLNPTCGDANGDGQITIGDLIYVINYMFKFGPPPPQGYSIDMDGCLGEDISDLTHLIYYIFIGGSPPICDAVPCTTPTGGSISLDHVDGLYGIDSIKTNEVISFYIRLTNNNEDHLGIANGFRIYSPDNGVSWGSTTTDTLGIGTNSKLTNFHLTPIDIDGIGADTVGFGGFGFYAGDGFLANSNEVFYRIDIGPIDPIHNGKTIVLDSSFYPPVNEWKWGGSDIIPNWEGPYSFTIVDPLQQYNQTPLIIIPGMMGTHIFQQDGIYNGFPPLTIKNCDIPENCECWYSFDDAARLTILGETYFNSLKFINNGQSPIDPSFNIGEGKVFGELPSDKLKLSDWFNFFADRDKNIYGDLIESLENQDEYLRDVNLFVFPYDWRYDNLVSAQKLKEFIDARISSNQKVDIIAHSMGGLITRLYSNLNTDKVDKVIFLGTPHHGSVEMLGALLGLKKIFPLSGGKIQEMAINYPSAYQLLPDDFYESTFPTGRSYYMDNCIYFSNNCRSRSIEDILSDSDINRFSYIDDYINPYRQVLGSSLLSIDNPFIIAGFGFPTPYMLTRNIPHYYYDYKIANGDGTVILMSSKDGLLGIGESNIFYRNQKHTLLPNDPVVINLVEAILLDRDYSNINNIEYEQPPYAYISGNTASPITVEITDDQGRRNYYNFEDSIEVVEIPNSYFKRFEHNETFAYDASCDCEVIIKGIGEGTFSLLINHTSNDSTISEMAFFDIPVNDSSFGILQIDSTETPFNLIYDYDNSGDLDTLTAIIPEEYVCCRNLRGNINGDALDQIDISDLVFLVAYSFQGGSPPPCDDEADVNGSGSIDVSDLVYLVAFSFQGGSAPAVCP